MQFLCVLLSLCFYVLSQNLEGIHVCVTKESKSGAPIMRCCDGYTLKDNQCEPQCAVECIIGTCVAPNTCECYEGFYGDYCERPIPLCWHGFWGEDCSIRCPCYNNSTCDPLSGTCICAPGYRGLTCKEQCPRGTYGFYCENKCQCSETAVCNFINGDCYCRSGYYMSEGRCIPRCEIECVKGTCIAPNTCKCDTGFTGDICDRSCERGFWGENCSNLCTCNSSACVPTNGTCICDDGYRGLNCEDECSEGTYGFNCENNCNCSRAGVCNFIDGRCSCLENYFRDDCSLYCPEGIYDSVYDTCLKPHHRSNDTIIPSTQSLLSANIHITLIVLLIITITLALVILCICKTCRRKRENRQNIEVHHKTLPNTYEIKNENLTEHLYEEIPLNSKSCMYDRLRRDE